MTPPTNASSTSTAPGASSASGTPAPDGPHPPHRRREFWRSPPDQPRWARPGLLGIGALAGLLYAWNITGSGLAPYYSLAARSMTESWKAFLFTTVDPAGTLTMDKIGGFLWPQALSARVFGFHDWALTLPQCVMGVISVLVLYRVVRRWQGPGAGLLAAGLLTVTPVVASMFGHAMADGSLTLCLVLAADQYQKAVGAARLRPLLLSALWVGLGFQMKMMEAWVIVPALFVGYLVAAPAGLWRRLGQLGAAGAVLFAVSLSWVALLTLTPADSRPYVDGSTDNSAVAMVFGYNGFNRLHTGLIDGAASASADGGGTKNGARSAPTAPPATSGPGQHGSGQEKGDTEGGAAGRQPFTDRPSGAPPAGTENAPAGNAPAGNAPADGARTPPEPPSRAALWAKLFTDPLAPQIGWLYPLAVFSLAMGVATHRGAARTHPSRAGFLMWGTWLVTGACVLSAIGNLFHTAYLSLLAPPLAALAAAGTVTLWRAHRASTGGRRGSVLPAVIAAEVAWTVHLAAAYTDFAPWLPPVILVAALIAVPALGLPRGATRRRAALAGLLAGCVAMFAAPTAWSLSVLNQRYAGSAFDASAGPPPAGAGTGAGPGRVIGAGSGVGGGPGTVNVSQDARTSLTPAESELLAHVRKHNGTAKYTFSAETTMLAAPYVYAEGVPVLPLGSMHGASRTLGEYRDLVAAGDVRFALVAEERARSSEISAWVRSACTEVGLTRGDRGSPSLYRCTAADAAKRS
ncbi:glycosyltransferase family 39 protein [Streptomyces sp. G44]|uniref:ArnT family glycosyltransferase n=1 Tax=Streptomyces sp. G44 TaxID=2807632 RepID=UPI00196225B2|nr:glycosyltransferase family 39 protein [Streptomyces sp. G44]MBM7171113.1 glycosyltransferase family 39 protein [Streptomyces sp. G44]